MAQFYLAGLKFDRGYDVVMNTQNNNINVTFIWPMAGTETHQGPIGDHVMDVAVDNGVAGIIAPVWRKLYLLHLPRLDRSNWQDRVRPAHNDETELLSYASGVCDRSRLACQLRLTQELDGLVVEIPSETE